MDYVQCLRRAKREEKNGPNIGAQWKKKKKKMERTGKSHHSLNIEH